jgi:ubiquinone/menaquinone biosynthesis C-methylase UbiE
MGTTTLAARETPDIETSSDAYARRFAGAAGAYLLARQDAAMREALRDWTGGSVLDVGGGHAQLLPLFGARASSVTVVGSDAASLERVAREFPRCRRVVGDLLALPLADASVDLVAAVRLVPHVENWPRLIAELCRVAKRTVIVDYPRIAGFNSLTPMMFPLKKRLEGNTRHYRNFRDRELDEAFRACSFEPRERHAQFLLPMVLHRRLGGARVLRGVEQLSQQLKLTSVLGSPVILRADRRGA